MSRAGRIGEKYLESKKGVVIAESGDGEYEILIFAVKVRAKDGSDSKVTKMSDLNTGDWADTEIHIKDLFGPVAPDDNN